MSPSLRSDMLRDTLRSLAKELIATGVKLDAVLLSGDATFRGDKDGQICLRKILLTELANVGIDEANLIVATPGNHDIVARTKPSSKARYKLFKAAWIKPGSVVVPFLDGIHDINNLNITDHVLKDPNGAWAVFPINTANWSQLSIPDKENEEVAKLRGFVNASGVSDHVKTLESLCTFDVARISPEQLRVLKELVNQTGDVRLRIAVLHHHLLPVNGSEEFKPFADITNLGQLRQVLRELGFHMVVHGHKHATAVHYDHIYPDDLDGTPAHRVLTVSGGTFGATSQQPDTPLRLIEIDGIPHSPICKIRSFSSDSAGRKLVSTDSPAYRLWEDNPDSANTSIVYGTSIDDVYARAIQTVEKHPNRTIICTVNFNSAEDTPFPLKYPYGESLEEKSEWFKDTVKWWQLPASKIESRIPYIHGSRLKRFGGSLDQINRVIKLLKDGKATSKAIALVIDPGRDFGDTAFASFCLVQFCLRPDNSLDCIGYYRAQEFHHWWPVNVAELRYLQKFVAKEAEIGLGEITTITPYPRLSENIRHPNKVAVPLIDQWVDICPVNIAKIALALANPTDSAHKDGIQLWNRCLDDLVQAANFYHKDGIQVSIEGLELLRDWLQAASGPQSTIKLVDDLLTANISNQDELSDRKKYELWKVSVEKKINALREIILVSPLNVEPPV
jgi:hypothetical protein